MLSLSCNKTAMRLPRNLISHLPAVTQRLSSAPSSQLACTIATTGTGSCRSYYHCRAPAFPQEALPLIYRRQIGIIHDVITQDEHDFLFQLCLRKLRHAPFLQGHFDKVISDYREMSVSNWRVGVDPVKAQAMETRARAIFARCYDLLNEYAIMARGDSASLTACEAEAQRCGPVQWLPEHILELGKSGKIGPHIDHLTASGNVVAALSFGSSTPIVFQHTKQPEWTIELHADPRSLYFQRDDLRYDFTHAVPKPRGEGRLSIMFRDRFLSRAQGSTGTMRPKDP